MLLYCNLEENTIIKVLIITDIANIHEKIVNEPWENVNITKRQF